MEMDTHQNFHYETGYEAYENMNFIRDTAANLLTETLKHFNYHELPTRIWAIRMNIKEGIKV